MPPSLLDGIHLGEGPFFSPFDGRIIGWVKEAVDEGERINRADPSYEGMEAAMDYVGGLQRQGRRPTYLPNVVVNQTKKAIRTHASALSDLRLTLDYKTFNERYKRQSIILNQLVSAWWVNSFTDLDVADMVKLSLTIGCADAFVEWDPAFGRYGDTRVLPRDPRDTLAVRPTRDRSLQTWMGVILKESHTPNALKATYPGYSFQSEADTQGWSRVFTRFRRALGTVAGSITSTLDGLTVPKGSGLSSSTIPEVNTYRIFLNDATPNLNTEPVLMGDPSSNWSYRVAPGRPLYPRKRLIVCTEKQILYDGPNPYWHGMFPVCRLKLDPWPWLFLGLGLTHDLRGLQDALNTTVNDFLQTFQLWVNRPMVADAQAVPESEFHRLDPRKPLNKFRVKASMGEGIKFLDGPNLPNWAMNFLEFLFRKHDELSETANLQALLQLRQMPSGDTIEKYYNSLTPGIRLEARLLEAFIRDLAEMVKCNVFQYYSQERRVLVLGQAGTALADFDYDPGSLVPAMRQSDPAYTPELDAELPRDERAQHFHRLFTFYVAPGSVLALHAQEKKLEAIQLARQGYMDLWTLLEILGVPNVGAPPPIPLPVADWKGPQFQDVQDPLTGQVSKVPIPPPLEVRIPVTITERLQAQQLLGIGMTASPVGRKATGQAPPKMVQRGDGSTTIRES